jgi:hypothetical protein
MFDMLGRRIMDFLPVRTARASRMRRYVLMTSTKRMPVDFLKYSPADGTNAVAEKQDFGTSCRQVENAFEYCATARDRNDYKPTALEGMN